MKKNITKLITITAFISISLVACKKSPVQNNQTEKLSQQATTKSADEILAITVKLENSTEFNNYQSSIKSMIELIDINKISVDDLKNVNLISNKANISKKDLDQVLYILKIDKNQYQINLSQQFTIIKNFQKINSLTNEQTKNVWVSAFNHKKKAILVYSLSNARAATPLDFACKVKAGATFAAASLACGALGAIPIIGEALIVPCAITAIATLTSDLVACAKADLVP